MLWSSLAGRWASRLAGRATEALEIALVDGAGRVLPKGILRIQEGTVDRVAVYPRLIMRPALLADAVGVVMAHNHPSGDPTPTSLDLDATRAVVLAGVSLDIRLIDHLIITEGGVFSFREAGLL
jgi:DNA repair protein RadC